jgi:uncharacterized GH25 family protein
MKIKVFNEKHQPLKNAKVTIQVKGNNDQGFSLATDANGELQLQDEYKGRQVKAGNGQWITANEGASITAQSSPQPQYETKL